MQSYFRLPWCTDQIAPKLQTGKAASDTTRASPVLEMPLLNKLKRKRTDSPEPSAPGSMQLFKKQRADREAARQSPPFTTKLPAKSEREHVISFPTCSDGLDDCSGRDWCAKGWEARQHWIIGPQAQHEEQSLPGYRKIAEAPLSQKKQMAEDVSMADARASSTEDSRGFSPLQQVIENEFNMQILMKHDELRLIELELAKCQVALEQLRRCEIQPYPGAEQPSAQVSAGTGQSIAPPPGHSRPRHAAPHGVTDGPYARHYSQWLLRDPQFDPQPPQSVSVGEDVLPDAMRSTRHAGSARKPVQKSSTMAGRAVEHMKSLPNYPTAPKDKSAPLVLRRSTDNQLVKLICNNCMRGNFSSIQGFLNHCRIAHKVDYKSHDAAAVDCGQVLNEQEVANLPPEALTAAAVHKPSASRSSSTTTTPFKTHSFVHPMNTEGMMMRPSMSGAAKNTASKLVPVANMASAAPSQSSSSLTPSSQVPRLSAHFAKHNLGGNLRDAITDAKQKVEFGADEVMSPDENDSTSPSTPVGPGARGGLGVPRAGSLAPPGAVGRPQSRKGHREITQRHRPSPLMPASANINNMQQKPQHEILESPNDRSSNLSPHTADSNPGLVSDHEDDDHGSASEDEVPQSTIAHSLGVSRGGCADSMDLDVAVDDDIDEHGVVIRRNSMIAADQREYRTIGGPSKTTYGAGNRGA